MLPFMIYFSSMDSRTLFRHVGVLGQSVALVVSGRQLDGGEKHSRLFGEISKNPKFKIQS